MQEQIILQSDAYDAAKISPPPSAERKSAIVFKSRGQKKSVRYQYTLLVQPFIELCCKQSKKSPANPVIFHVGFLSAEAHSQWVLCRPLLAALLIAVLCAVGLSLFQWWLTTLAVGVACDLLAGCFYLTLDKHTIFYSKAAGAPVVFISHKKQSKKALLTFVEQLRNTIADNPLPKEVNALAEETKLLRQFLAAGVLKQQAYEQYRDVVLKQYPKRQ